MVVKSSDWKYSVIKKPSTNGNMRSTSRSFKLSISIKCGGFSEPVFFDMWAVIKTHQWHSIKNSLLNRDRYTGVSYDPYISLSSIISQTMQQKKRNFGHCSCERLTSKSEKLKVNKTTPRVHSPLPKTQNPTPRGHHRQTLLGAVMQQPTMVACVLRLADGLIKCPPPEKKTKKSHFCKEMGRYWEGHPF